MREIVRQLLESLDRQCPVAYCRLVETRGSTPQKAGAAMLVFPDGKQVGTLGGGCVEAEVKRQAIQILADGSAQIVRFQLDSDYGWDDGLICGGRMQILIDPLRQAEDRFYFQQLDQLLASRAGFTEAIVFDREASQLNPPASFLFDEAQELLASTHTGQTDIPALIAEHLPQLADRPRASALHGIAFLPCLPRCRLLIVGGGHVGQGVAQLASDLDFDVWIVDDRSEYVSQKRFPHAQQRICGDIDRILPELEITTSTYCLIVTRGHNHDEEALYHLVERNARYVGMIGSKRKIRLIFDDLLDKGISADSLARVYAPVGIDIGSQTVPEIALSILAELVAHRNCHGEVPGRTSAISVGDSQP